MAEHGYFHPDRGYWQAVSDVPQHILDSYPEGTIEVSLKPSGDHDWNGSGWVHVAPDLKAMRLDAETSRALAYAAEADPLFFKYQRGEATQQDWLDKVEEIRVRYPYPEE
jgi:hypothetical protein